MKITIRDYLNNFGTVTAAGVFPNNIYVGRGTNTVSDPNYPAEGGEIKTPYFAEFFSGNTAPPTAEVKLTVEGAPDNGGAAAPGSGWVEAGSLVIPAGEWDKAGKYNVAFSDTKYKWFRAKIAGSGTAAVNAFLKRG